MRLYERATASLIEGDEQLVLHLSEPHFTLWQRLKRRFWLTIAIIQDWLK